jgi:hypothetical protein
MNGVLTIKRYEERVYNPRWLIALLGGIAIFQGVLAAGMALQGEISGAILFGALALLVGWFGWALRWFEVRVDENGLRYGWAGMRATLIPTSEIVSAQPGRYPWYYGYGWRVSGTNVAYSIPFAREALRVEKRRGPFRVYWFTLKGASAAADALKELRSR